MTDTELYNDLQTEWENDIVTYDSLQESLKNKENTNEPIDGFFISYNDIIMGVFDNQEEAADIFSKIDKNLKGPDVIKETVFSMNKPVIRAFKVNNRYQAYIKQNGLGHRVSGETDDYCRLRLVSCKIVVD